jgi:hypothetical protein
VSWLDGFKRRTRKAPELPLVPSEFLIPAAENPFGADPCLYFARSWTGELMFRAMVAFEPGVMVVMQIKSAEGQEPAFARRVVDYLIKTLVFGAVVPHPLPANLPPQPQKVDVFSFATFGRQCRHGTYADTTVLPSGAPGESAPGNKP